MEDIDITKLYWNREQSAIEHSHTKYGPLLFKIAFGILSSREDSEECVNDTYLKAWNSIPPQKPVSLKAYLGSITRNLSISRFRMSKTQKRGETPLILDELSECIPSSATTEQQVELRLLTNAIERWLDSLSQKDRVLFVRRYWYGDDFKALSEIFMSTPSALTVRLFRLRQKLREALAKEDFYL